MRNYKTKQQKYYRKSMIKIFLQILPTRYFMFQPYFKNIIMSKIMKDYRNVINSPITITYPDVSTAFILYLTLPIMVAAAERSFSKLKIIKNYLRNRMTKKCL